jgi:hypothetical protein
MNKIPIRIIVVLSFAVAEPMSIGLLAPTPPLKHSSTRVFYTFLHTYSRIEKVDYT